MEKCGFCGATEDLQTHHWLYNEEGGWTVTLCVNCHQNLHSGHGVGRGRGYSTQSFQRKPFVWNGKAIKRYYKVRPFWKSEVGEKGKEVTLHPDWCEYNGIHVGDKVTIIVGGVMFILPPNVTEEREAEVRKFLEG